MPLEGDAMDEMKPNAKRLKPGLLVGKVTTSQVWTNGTLALENEMLNGANIPKDSVPTSETGSGYNGRTWEIIPSKAQPDVAGFIDYPASLPGDVQGFFEYAATAPVAEYACALHLCREWYRKHAEMGKPLKYPTPKNAIEKAIVDRLILDGHGQPADPPADDDDNDDDPDGTDIYDEPHIVGE